MKAGQTRGHAIDQTNKSHTFGVIQREVQPSMFDVLAWNTHGTGAIPTRKPVEHKNPAQSSAPILQVASQGNHTTVPMPSAHPQFKPKPNDNAAYVQNIMYYKPQKTRVQRPITAELYAYDEVVPVVKRNRLKTKEQFSPNKPRPYSAHPNRSNKQVHPKEKRVEKPPFAAYGRGNTHTQFDYMKSHNVLPHSGTNHPTHNETYESALIVKSKYQPGTIQNAQDVNDSDILHFSLPEQSRTKVALVSSKPVSTIHNNKGKSNKNKKKKRRLGGQSSSEDEKDMVNKNKKEPPLKFMNRRGDFIQQLREEQVKKNRLALKPTECYPGQYNVKSYDLARSHSSHACPAGKKTQQHFDIRQLMVYPPYS